MVKNFEGDELLHKMNEEYHECYLDDEAKKTSRLSQDAEVKRDVTLSDMAKYHEGYYEGVDY